MTATMATLARIDAKRLEKAREGLARGDYSVTVQRHTAGWLNGEVTSREGVTYTLTATPSLTSCTCPDVRYARKAGHVCKHAAMLALMAA